MNTGLADELSELVGPEGWVAREHHGPYRRDATEARGLQGTPDAVVMPSDAAQVAAVVAWCYARDLPVIPRGGGSGFAGGAVPTHGGVVVDLGRLTRVHSFDPLLWRMKIGAGLRTSEVRRLAREHGLSFPPDPGAAEQSQLGGNIATNAGGPHAFKYGVTGAWVTGLEAVVAPGEMIELGGPIRKDVAGYDLLHLLVGSEGTLGIITAAWLRLIPAPEATRPVVAVYPDVDTGCRAIRSVLGSGLIPAAIEYLDQGTLALARGSFPGALPAEAGFMVITEADGSVEETQRLSADLHDALDVGAIAFHEPVARRDIAALWRWRDGVSLAVASSRGGKASEDIAVPLDHLADAITATIAIGERHGIPACSWGHAGDANLHSTFLLDPHDLEQQRRAEAASAELFALAGRLGGTISGEHGVGWVKRGRLDSQWSPKAVQLHHAVKQLFDPKGLINPGKKT